MFNFNLRYCFIVLTLILGACQNQAADFEVYDLKRQQSFDSGYKTVTSFSWKIDAQKNNWQQGAYQIVVSSTDDKNGTSADFWDSGKIMSDNQLFIPYSGKRLDDGEKYYWKVKVWEKNGKSYKWSKTESFIVPLTSYDEWKAKWITNDYRKEAPAPLFRKKFTLREGQDPISARLFICGLGYYEAFLNGQKIGDRMLEPAQTNYEDYALYSVYDIPGREIEKEKCWGSCWETAGTTNIWCGHPLWLMVSRSQLPSW